MPLQRDSTCAVYPLGRVAAPGSLLRLAGQSCRPLTAAGTASGVLGLWGGHLSKPHMLPSLLGIDGHTQQPSAGLWARHLAAEPDAVRDCSACFATLFEMFGSPARELAGRSAVPCACRYAGRTHFPKLCCSLAVLPEAQQMAAWHRSCQGGMIGPELPSGLLPGRTQLGRARLDAAIVLNACPHYRLRSGLGAQLSGLHGD